MRNILSSGLSFRQHDQKIFFLACFEKTAGKFFLHLFDLSLFISHPINKDNEVSCFVFSESDAETVSEFSLKR